MSSPLVPAMPVRWGTRTSTGLGSSSPDYHAIDLILVLPCCLVALYWLTNDLTPSVMSDQNDAQFSGNSALSAICSSVN